MNRSNKVATKANVDAATLARIDADARENGSRAVEVAAARLMAHFLDTGKVQPFAGHDLTARRLSLECEALQDRSDRLRNELILTEAVVLALDKDRRSLYRDFVEEILAGIAPLITPEQLAEARAHLDHSLKNVRGNRETVERIAKEEAARWRTRH